MAFPGGAAVKNLSANAGDPRDAGSIPGLEDSLEWEIAPHSSILAWKIPWTEEPGRLQLLDIAEHTCMHLTISRSIHVTADGIILFFYMAD